MDKETLSNYGWIVILVLILAVMLALATPFGNFIAGAIKATTAGFFNVNGNALGSVGITIPGQDFDEPNAPGEPARDPLLNPDDGTTPTDGETYEDSVYIYTYYQEYDGWHVALNLNKTDKLQQTYPVILESINGKLIKSMFSTFQMCSELVTAPAIPYGVENMECTFYWCHKLTNVPEIPDRVQNLSYTFACCDGFKVAPEIPNSAKRMDGTFRYCGALEVAPTIPVGVTDVNNIFAYCANLKTYAGSTGTDYDFSGYVIPNTVVDIGSMFESTNIKKAPVIPESVYKMNSTFEKCTALTDDVVINTNQITTADTWVDVGYCGSCFKNVDMRNITLKGSASKTVLNLIGGTGNYWSYMY
jgi:hypothetical protein